MIKYSITVILLAYLAFSFILWNFNAMEWGMFERGVFIITIGAFLMVKIMITEIK